MIFPGIGNAAASLATSSAALSAITAARGATFVGPSDASDFAPDAVTGEWQGVECCPDCLQPVTQHEKWSNCCSKCGHTDRVYLSTKTRARKPVLLADGSQRWEYKDGAHARTGGETGASNTPDQFFPALIFVLTVLCVGAATASILML